MIMTLKNFNGVGKYNTEFFKKTWHHTKYVIYNLHMSGVDFQKEMFLNVNI